MFSFIKRKQFNSNYNWVEKYLQGEKHLKQSPYLWTRIKANLEAHSIEGQNKTLQNLRIQPYLKWAVSLGFIISVSLGTLVGKELSKNMFVSDSNAAGQQLEINNSLEIQKSGEDVKLELFKTSEILQQADEKGN